MTIFSSVERKHWTSFHKIHQNIILKVGDAFCFYHILYSLTWWISRIQCSHY